MINQTKYSQISKVGLLLDHYYILMLIKGNKDLPQNKKIFGFKNLLQKKGYLDEEFQLTEKGSSIVEDIEFEISTTTTTTTTMSPDNVVPRRFLLPENNIGVWAEDVHLKCQDKIVELTGKKQVRAMLDKKAYSFLPNAIDLGRVLFKVISTYKLNDYTKIEKSLLRYIEKCNRENQWFPLMQYFIFKNGTSQLVTFMEEDEDQDYTPDKGTSQKFI